MARPRKEGLDYFPLDVHFDEKIKALELLHKNDGLVWIIKFWQNAYQTNSGEVNLKGLFGVIQAENCRITTGKQADIVRDCMEIGLIAMISDGIYTSNGIQKRLNEIVKDREFERKRKLVGSFPVENEPLTGESKVKESKENNTNEQKLKSNQLASFNVVWQKYPRRLGKKQAFRHYCASVKNKEDYDKISIALDNYLKEIETREIQDKFIKHGSSWFNNWQDYLEIGEIERWNKL